MKIKTDKYKISFKNMIRANNNHKKIKTKANIKIKL